MSHRPSTERRIADLNAQLQQRKTDQQQILLERIRDKEHAEVYTEMLKTCEDDMKKITEQIRQLEDLDATIKKRKIQLRTSMDLIDSIVADGAISDTHIRMLVDKITVSEVDGKLNVQITLNGKFRMHIDTYNENGEIVERDAEAWCFPDWEDEVEEIVES
jgi:hypothetical protein